MTQMIETRINGKWDLLLPEHRAARKEWATGWERERLDALHDAIEPGMTVVEVGAEEGDMTALIGQWVGAEGTVFMFEPNKRVWPNIRAIWESNQVPAKFYAMPIFAADTSTMKTTWGKGTINCWPDSAHGELIGDHGFLNLSERDDVPRIKLDQLPYQPDIINIDCEGSELRVLKGAEHHLRRGTTVFVSVHDAFMAEMYDEYAADLFKYMKTLGYGYDLLAYDHELHVRFTKS